MGWLGADITTKEKGWKIVLKLFVITSISFIIGERLGISNMDVWYRYGLGVIVILGLSGFWFFMTRIVKEQ